MDVKELLYAQINEMGISLIHKKLSESRENSVALIDELMNSCSMIIEDRPFSDTDRLTLAESLIHYLLTTMMIPSQRKIKIGEIEISVIIPNLRNLSKNPEQVLFIQFINQESSDIQGIIRSLKALQPIHHNIWVISYLPINVPSQIKNYCISKPATSWGDDKLQFASIIYDAEAFIDKLNGFHFKIF
jgi:hypothetical protein